MKALFIILIALAVSAADSRAQGHFDQVALEDLLARRAVSLYDIPEVTYSYYVPEEESGLRARLKLWEQVGRDNAPLIKLLNRIDLERIQKGDTLILPSHFEEDLRAYSPYPHIYVGGLDFDKLVVIDKTTQTFAAYHYGELEKWGLVNTGSLETPTPNGRFNANWRQEYRRSSLNWNWEMWWVVNFHESRGIHMHHYAMPMGGPASHGCVRMVDADAEWLYEWVDLRRTRNGRIVDQGTTIIVVGEEFDEDPVFFTEENGVPKMIRVDLPESPWDVEPGTPQQRNFDRVRNPELARRMTGWEAD